MQTSERKSLPEKIYPQLLATYLNVVERTGFGVRVPISGPFAGADAIAKTAIAAESLGFDGVWCHDYITWTKELHNVHISCGSLETLRPDQKPNFFESISTLAYLAGLTKRLTLGISVLIAPLRNPVLAAKQLSIIDNLSNGRLIAGVGIGATRATKNVDFEILGVSRLEKNERTNELVEILTGLWDHNLDKFSYTGKFFKFSDAEMFPKPIQKPRPPFWFAGTIEKALVRVAKYGEGWLPGGLSPEEYAKSVAFIKREAKEKFSRDLSHLKVANQIYVSIDTSPDKAKENARATLLNNSKAYDVFIGENAFERASDVSLVGSPKEIIEKIRRYGEAGVNYYEMKFIYQSMGHFREQLELFSKEVIPSF
ncbi:MAG: LLM class flavin-dependent oxidoreductase [Thaumarchaeota archaeon]|nr:LLM class flavin-dependent oxidoreductase [Nitrososphaerota archaeon]